MTGRPADGALADRAATDSRAPRDASGWAMPRAMRARVRLELLTRAEYPTPRTDGVDRARLPDPTPLSSLGETEYHWSMKVDPLLDALGRAGLRVTEPRRTVGALIASHAGHFTAADLEAEARRGHVRIGRATVFRALELFTQLGAVERIDLPSGERAYVRCDPVHHHHVVCTRCGATADVEGCGMPDVVRQVGLRTGYRVEGHRLELYGLCPACQRESEA